MYIIAAELLEVHGTPAWFSHQHGNQPLPHDALVAAHSTDPLPAHLTHARIEMVATVGDVWAPRSGVLLHDSYLRVEVPVCCWVELCGVVAFVLRCCFVVYPCFVDVLPVFC